MARSYIQAILDSSMDWDKQNSEELVDKILYGNNFLRFF